jgi:hypothetical protein
VQEFELVPGGARYLREVSVAPNTPIHGSAFDLAFAPDGKYFYVADGSNNRVWSIERESLKVLGWASTLTETEGDSNWPASYALMHRFRLEPSTGDLLLACTTRKFLRMKYLGVH